MARPAPTDMAHLQHERCLAILRTRRAALDGTAADYRAAVRRCIRAGCAWRDVADAAATSVSQVQRIAADT